MYPFVHSKLTSSLYLLFTLLILPPLSINAQNCGCIPQVYEGFDYPEGDNMHQKVGGTGWGGAWNSQTGDQRVGFRVGTNTLTYSNLRSNYKSFVGGHYWHRIGRSLDIRPTGALGTYIKTNGLIGKAGTTLWTSAVFQKTQDNNEESWFGLHNTNVDWYEGNPGTTNSRMLFGYFGTANSSTNGIRYWTLRIGDVYYKTTVPIVAATPIFAVIKLQFDVNSTTINVFVNPPNLGSGADPSLPTLSVTTTTALEFRHFSAYGDANINNFILDEIRFADNYRCVAPDATVAENLLPTARMTISASTGIAPLTVNLNGTTSSDPDGTLNNYEWTFGDGGTRNGATASYTFNNTGVLYARLKVTDNCGSTNSATQNVVVTDANGQISCLSAPVPEAFPNCAGTGGGVIRMDGGLGTNFTLTHQNGTTFPFANSRFSNLPIGNYTLMVTGQSGCAESFPLTLPADSMNCPTVAANPHALVFGMGLEGLSYWDKGRPFKDFMKTSDSQLITFTPNGTVWNTNMQSEIPMDTEGYPTVIPVLTSIGLQRVRIVFSAGGHLPIGDYLLLYDGEGTLYLRGNMTVSPTSTAGRLVFRVNNEENMYLDIDYSKQGNHLRNFRLIRPQDETTYLTQPFHQPFLDKLCRFNPIRFMDWQQTNASELVNWSDRGKPIDRSQTMRNGVSYEHIVQLGNTLNRDIWICVPHAATDDYIRQMARLFRNNLNPNLNIMLEYSNEVWNWQFTQAHWVANNGNQNISYPRRYVDRSLNAFRIWHEEFAGQTHRVKRVLATQTGYNWVSEQILAQAKGAFDYFSPTFYFGYGGACLDNLRTLGAAATPTDVINCTRQSMRAFFPNVSQTYRLSQLYGKPIAHYEGGQHMTSNPTIEPFQTALYASQIDPQIKTLYQEMIDSMRRYGGTAFATAFVLTGARESRYGSWGHVEDSDQNLTTQAAPKYQVLVENFRTNQPACNTAVLPINLLDFKGSAQKEGNLLTWTVEKTSLGKTSARLETSTTLGAIEVEKSEDGLVFWRPTTAEKTSSRFQTSTTLDTQSAQFLDESPFDLTYYRLKITELDGKTTFSKIISLKRANILRGVKIYPNPAKDVLFIENAEEKDLQIINTLGQVVITFQKVQTFGKFTLPIATLKNGVYFVKIGEETAKFVKN